MNFRWKVLLGICCCLFCTSQGQANEFYTGGDSSVVFFTSYIAPEPAAEQYSEVKKEVITLAEKVNDAATSFMAYESGPLRSLFNRERRRRLFKREGRIRSFFGRIRFLKCR